MKKSLITPIILLNILFVSCNGNNMDGMIEASGNIEGTNITVSSQTAGEIDKILKDEGSLVNKGDTIIIIDPINYKLKLNESLSILQSSESQYSLLKTGARKEDIAQSEEALKQAEVNFSQAEKDKDRYTSLFESKSITRKQYEDAINRYEIASAQYNSAKENVRKIKNLARPDELKQAEANVNRVKASIEQLQKNINDCFVTAPSNGYIVKKFVEEGEYAGMLSSLFKITDLRKVELVIYVSETDLGKVKLGQVAEVSVDSYPDKNFKGNVTYISPEAEFTPKNIQTKDERTKLVFAVKISIPNPDLELKPGMPADALINVR
ncbi:MAG: efflux RND transporter periplasmic adaptor subunit [Ignavibacteriaceae bacterium]